MVSREGHKISREARRTTHNLLLCSRFLNSAPFARNAQRPLQRPLQPSCQRPGRIEPHYVRQMLRLQFVQGASA
jgi:hypothetical protein